MELKLASQRITTNKSNFKLYLMELKLLLILSFSLIRLSFKLYLMELKLVITVTKVVVFLL